MVVGVFNGAAFGAKAPDAVETGHATSAPAKPMLWRKAGITTAIAGFCLRVFIGSSCQRSSALIRRDYA